MDAIVKEVSTQFAPGYVSTVTIGNQIADALANAKEYNALMEQADGIGKNGLMEENEKRNRIKNIFANADNYARNVSNSFGTLSNMLAVAESTGVDTSAVMGVANLLSENGYDIAGANFRGSEMAAFDAGNGTAEQLTPQMQMEMKEQHE